MIRTVTKVGPKDHGRRMSLADFEHAEVQAGYLYELGRGVVIVSDVPGRRHFLQVNAIRRQFAAFDLANPGLIFAVLSGSECKILAPALESERHPDSSVYLSAPPDAEQPWASWIPAIVIEVVSAESSERDYVEKPEEYFAAGVREYWIVDQDRQEVSVLRRWGRRWREVVYARSASFGTRLLPGFELDCEAVFAAAETVGE